jgi:hypothetical protein
MKKLFGEGWAWLVGIGVVYLMTTRKRKVPAAITQYSTTEAEEARAIANYYEGLIDDTGQVVEAVPGVTMDADSGEPIPLHGESPQSWEARAMAYTEMTGYPMPTMIG